LIVLRIGYLDTNKHRTPNFMKAFILAAGRGSRLLTLTDDRPKCWVKLYDKPLIQWQLATLRKAGISDITIVTGYLSDAFNILGVSLAHNPEWADTNMVESLFSAEPDFGDDILVCYADIVYEPRILENISKSTAAISIVADRSWHSYWQQRFDDPLSDAETFRANADGTITDIGQKPKTINEIQGQYVGLLRFRGEGIAALKTARKRIFSTPPSWMGGRKPAKAYMTDILQVLIEGGYPPIAVDVHGGWVEIDTPSDLDVARKITHPADDGTLRIVDARTNKAPA